MSPAYSDSGFVIKVADSGEADKLICIISDKHGFGVYIARGARRPTSKKSPHLDLANLIKFSVGRNQNPKFINQAETMNYYPGIKNDYRKIGIVLTVFEVLYHSLPQDVEDRELFLSLNNFLTALDKARNQGDTDKISRQFGLYLIRHLGFPLPQKSSDSLSTYLESIINHKIISKDIK